MKVSCESASADEKAAEEFLEILDKLIVEENYLPEQIFNVDENSLFWKRMPERTFIRGRPSQCQAFKDRVTVLAGGNATNCRLQN